MTWMNDAVCAAGGLLTGHSSGAIQNCARRNEAIAMAPRVYTKPRDLTPAMRRYMTERGWIDRRTVTRIERPDPEHVARMYRLLELSPAPAPGVDVKA